MAYTQQKKYSLDEKRLGKIREQLYGAELPKVGLARTKPGFYVQESQTPSSASSQALTTDLVKVGVIAASCLLIQLGLFLAHEQRVLNF